jgi:hypothetical protein
MVNKNKLIYLKNKDTLIFDDFSFKCSVGTNGLSYKKKKRVIKKLQEEYMN